MTLDSNPYFLTTIAIVIGLKALASIINLVVLHNKGPR